MKAYAGGIAIRYVLHSNPQSTNIYIAESTLVILSVRLTV